MSDVEQQTLPDWAGILEAGGVDAWIDAELRRRDLLDEGVDTSKLTDKERKKYKARREEERRVRRLLKKHGFRAYRGAHLVHVGQGIFHHDVSDIDKFDIDDPDQRLVDNELPPIVDVAGLADALGLTVPRLRWLVFHRDVDSGTHYHRWHIPKRAGGFRLISAPKPDLKRCQRWIARAISEHLPVHGAAHAFLAGRSTVTNARVHAGARVVVKLDLADFYPTVTFPRVKGMFRKAGFREQVATILALLCTESPREELVLRGRPYHVATGPRSLPQGAPTSPSLANAVCLKLDSRLSGLARKLGARYSRYADDLTFSFADKKAPVGLLLRVVRAIVEDEGFEVHGQKTRVMRSGARQKITGLVVNAPNREVPPARVPRKLVRRLRAAIKNRELGRPGQGESLEQLRGWAAYVYMTDAKRGRQLLERLNQLS